MFAFTPSIRRFALLALFALVPAQTPAQETEASPASLNRKVHILLMGLTDDPSIGSGISTNVDEMKRILETGLPVARIGNFRIMKGKEITAKNLINAVERIAVDPQDTLFCYYSGHGAYDPGRGAKDASGGHFFQIPSGDLMRKDLWAALSARRAALTVLISDTCNVRAVAAPVFPRKYYEVVGENPVLVSLLLRHKGAIDISGSSRDQFGWFTSPFPGGWFTHALTDVAVTHHFPNPAAVAWPQFVSAVSDATSKTYLTRKSEILAKPGKTSSTVLDQLRGQKDQRPQIFQKTFKDTGAPTPPTDAIYTVGLSGLRLEGRLTGSESRDRVRTDSFQRVYLVRLEAGHSYVIELGSPAMDMFLRVESASAAQLAYNDDAVGRDSRLVFRPSATGVYRIIATTFNRATGPFALTIRHEAAPTDPTVGPKGLVYRGELNHKSPMDRVRVKSHCAVYNVFLVGGRTYLMTLSSPSMDTFLRVENTARVTLTYDDDSGPGLNSQLYFHPSRSGVYRVVATTFNHAVGPFELRIREQ
ncbi:MAG: caspase family protein [Gemmataceae bacterium]